MFEWACVCLSSVINLLTSHINTITHSFIHSFIHTFIFMLAAVGPARQQQMLLKRIQGAEKEMLQQQMLKNIITNNDRPTFIIVWKQQARSK
jgi:hypothetical protein